MSSAAAWYLDKSVKCLFFRPLNAAFSSFVLSFTRCIEIIQSQAQEEGDRINHGVTKMELTPLKQPLLSWHTELAEVFSIFLLRRVGGIVSTLNGKITFDTAFLLRSKKLSAKADTLPLTYLSWKHFLDLLGHDIQNKISSPRSLCLCYKHSPSFSSLLW